MLLPKNENMDCFWLFLIFCSLSSFRCSASICKFLNVFEKLLHKNVNKAQIDKIVKTILAPVAPDIFETTNAHPYEKNTPICQKICVNDTKLAVVFSSGTSLDITVKLIGRSAPEANPAIITPTSNSK